MASESNQVTQVKLKGSNYSYWSYLLKVFITGKELRGYLDGSVVAPEESDTNYEKLQQEWETNNARILSWINNSVEPSIGMHFSKFTSAKEVWDYLEGLYMQSNFAKRYELENVIRGERQDDKSVQEFYNVMNGIWDQLDLMDPLELRKLAIYQKVREEQKLVQFLMALRTEFEPLRGSMLHRSPLPSVDKVLSELVAEETRLKSSLLHSMQTQAVLVATQRPQFLPLVPSRATPPSGNFRIALDECSFCHEKGHWKRDCPKLRKKGILPSPNHFSQNSRNAQRTMNTGAFMTSVIAPDSSHTSGVTHEDVQSMVTQQIQQLLGTSLNAQPSTSTAMSASPASAHSMNHSGKTSSWIFDSGASHHMTHDSSILVERSTSFIPSSIQTADGSSMEVHQLGSIDSTSFPSGELCVSNVLHVPKLSVNLLSISQLVDAGCDVIFSPSGCVVQDRHTGRQIGTGRRDGGLYFLQNLFVSPGIAENSALSAFQLNKHSSPFQLWHCRLGHVSGKHPNKMVRLKGNIVIYLRQLDLFCYQLSFQVRFGVKLSLPLSTKEEIVLDPFANFETLSSHVDSSPEIFVPDEVMSSPLPFPSDTPSLPESNADPDDARPSPSQVAPSQFVSAPRSVHWSAVVRILRYIHGTLSRGLLISSSPDLTLSAYSDADWAGDVSDRRSTTGFCIFLGDSLISWKCKKQSVVSRSSSEAEYRAMANTTAEIVWVRWLLRDMGATQSSPTPMFCDNKSAVEIAHNSVFHERTKHIEIDCHFVRHHFHQGTITLPYVSSSLQLADFFTKSHTFARFTLLLGKLSMVSLSHREFEGG
ncbi:hypothetical protein RJ640_001740 [Escallonia rubra]|uniref:CCHC-type domain-containing protein n=1 Tax=Escallonia rubra TaxID=112253 RepID=A0AA88RIN0_9ASTE|nr:hypothetical protein RJ640_001740 [Escallonia rubra]